MAVCGSGGGVWNDVEHGKKNKPQELISTARGTTWVSLCTLIIFCVLVTKREENIYCAHGFRKILAH